MNLRFPTAFHSLRFKLIFGLLLMVIPLVAFMIYNNLYAIGVVRNQVAQSNKNLISLYMKQIDRNLDEVDKYLYTIAAQETGLLVLESPREENSDQYSFTKIQLNNKLLKDLPNNKPMEMFFVYSAPNRDLLTVMGERVDMDEQEAVENGIMQIFQDKTADEKSDAKEWFVRQMGERYYITRVIKYGNIYIGAWVNADKLMVPLNLIDFGRNGTALLATEHYEAMANRTFIRENRIDLNYTGTDYTLTGTNKQFLVSGGQSAKGHFSLVAVIPDSVILENLPFLRRIVSFISLGALVLLPFILFLLRKTVLTPINRIMTAMRRIEDGNLDVRLTHRTSVLEFEMMNHTFNRMISQIQELKINVLEEQLKHQKAELRHLQLQINPHFFLNSLNIIYNLAVVKNFALIQEMSLCLVQYFRFMFRSNLTFVTLKDEMEHTLNYLRIQEMRFPENLTYELSVPERLMEQAVPPLVIQTFVENTIKHAVSMDRTIRITIGVEEAQGSGLLIRIRDTGKGFPEEVLAKLQLEMDIGGGEGRHIGIWNVQRRLRLLYRDEARIAFSNGPDQGAVVEIFIPYADKDEVQEEKPMLHLLIVDDEIHAVRGIKAGVAWEEMGFAQVHEAYNIRQAKEMFGAHRIDVLICDIEMPEGNGFELLTWVKEHSPETESLFLTCHAEFEYAQKAIQLGSLDYMLKPVRFPELETAVRKAIAKREKERDLIRFKETYNHYYRLWESYQPLFIERFWRELIQRSVPSRKEHILEIAAKQNIPYNGDMTFLPVLVSVQRWHKSLTLREEKIMEYALRNSLEELPVIQQYKGQIVQVKNGALLAVLTAGCEAGMDKSKLGAGFQEYIDACSHYFFCDLCCYIGSPSSIEEIPDRFDALTAMEARNVTQSNKAFFLSDQKPAYDTIPLPQMNGWAEMLKCGCTQALAAEIDSYLHAMKRMERLDAKLLRGFYEDFLQMIHHVLHSEGLRAHQVFSEALRSIQASSATRSVGDLRQWVNVVLNEVSGQLHTAGESRSAVDKVKQFITQHIGEDISREDIASHVNLNPDYLTRMFKKETGLTISEYVLQERVGMAKEMLAKTNLPVGSIAASVGYTNFSHFSKMFKKAAAIGPQDYRKLHGCLCR